mmetsp:Transcript_19545/g.27426  ORF Transcript_19545/g.27426 Transcript_19545/m.27426 type:complete len:262 (-) Transcript_19545:62-847(-)
MNFNSFDLTALTDKINGGEPGKVREAYFNLVKCTETAERYPDMCKCMRAMADYLCTNNIPLSIDERNLLSVAYKNVVGHLRSALRAIDSEPDELTNYAQMYKEQVVNELKELCDDILGLLKQIISTENENNIEALVFYYKMTGDYHRYLAETDEEAAGKAGDAYKEAMCIAETGINGEGKELGKPLPTTHPIRLGLALNYSVCFYEILKEESAACDLAKRAFDDAIAHLDKLEEADYKDSTLIMQLLRDNLTLWTNNDAEN